MINSEVNPIFIQQNIREELKLPITRGLDIGVTMGVVMTVERNLQKNRTETF